MTFFRLKYRLILVKQGGRVFAPGLHQPRPNDALWLENWKLVTRPNTLPHGAFLNSQFPIVGVWIYAHSRSESGDAALIFAASESGLTRPAHLA